MNRSERRAAERKARIENRKGSILIKPDELNRMKRDITHQAAGYNTEALMSCFALTMCRLGMDDEKICESLRIIDKLMDDLLNDRATMEDYKKELEETTGIIVQCED